MFSYYLIYSYQNLISHFHLAITFVIKFYVLQSNFVNVYFYKLM